jgi:hypothetical protein
MTHGKPSGVAAAQTMATDIGRALQAEQPAAWAAFADDSSESGVTALNREAVEEVAAKFGWNVAPLYRSPRLTDAERTCLGYAIRKMDAEYAAGPADVLRGLLERLG